MVTLKELVVAASVVTVVPYAAYKLYKFCTKTKNDDPQETKVKQEMQNIKMKPPLNNDRFTHGYKSTV